MAVGEVRLMAEGRMIGWDDLAMSPGRRKRIHGNRMGREFHLGLKKFLGQMAAQLKNSLKEAIKKDELMEQFEKDLGSGAVDTLSKMETKQAQELLTKLEEDMAGISEEKRKMAVWSLTWMAEKKKEELREKEERARAEEREKKLEEESRRESQSKNSETASENLMDDRSRKWEDRRRLEREGDEIIELLVKHEEKEAGEKREKKAEEKMGKM